MSDNNISGDKATKFDVILLAGNRPGAEPLSIEANVSCKALVPIAGKPMLYYPLKTLLGCNDIGSIWILHQDVDAFDNDAILAPMIADPRVIMHMSGAGISRSVAALINGSSAHKAQCPIMLTTGDNVLISDEMIGYFAAAARGYDVAVAMVESETLLAEYPESKRTWLKFRGGKWSGANMFWFGSQDKILPILEFWQSIEQDRKKGRKIIGAFGIRFLLASILRLITLPDALAKAAQKFGASAKLVAMPYARACIDVDKAEDVILTQKILNREI